MRTPFIRSLLLLVAMHVSAAAAFAQTRVTVTNVPAGVPVQAILNAGNDSKPLPPPERSGSTLNFSMLADAANFGKPVQVYLVREEDDNDRPAGVFFIIDNGAVPPNGRLIGTFTLTSLTSDVVVDYQSGQLTARQPPLQQSGRGGLYVGLYGDWINFTNAGGDDICTDAPAGAAVVGCDRDTSGGGWTFAAGYGEDVSSNVSVGAEVAFGTTSRVTLDRRIAGIANPAQTAAQHFVFDPRALEVLARVGIRVTPDSELSFLAGVAHLTSETTNTFTLSVGGTVVDTQTTTTDNSSWSPVVGVTFMQWLNQRLGVEGGYRRMRLKDGEVDEPIHRLSIGVRFIVVRR